MTSPDPKEGAALPDVWIDKADVFGDEAFLWNEDDGTGELAHYVPASRVQELTERLERAVAVIEQIQHDLHTAKIWGGMKWDYVPLRQQLVEQIDKRCAAFLAAHQEPKP